MAPPRQLLGPASPAPPAPPPPDTASPAASAPGTAAAAPLPSACARTAGPSSLPVPPVPAPRSPYNPGSARNPPPQNTNSSFVGQSISADCHRPFRARNSPCPPFVSFVRSVISIGPFLSNPQRLTSSVIARSTRSRAKHPAHRVLELAQVLLPEPPLPHRPALLLQKTRRIRGHSVAGARIRSHSGPPFAHVSQKNPRLPYGVLISHNAPSLVASIGRIARYTSSLTRDASSTSSSDTAENPRIVASVPGSPTIRDPFGSASDISLSPSPFGRIFSLRTNPAAFRRNSPLCRALGLTTSVRLPASVYAWCTAFAAVIVDFPHCREQFRIPRLPAALPAPAPASGRPPVPGAPAPIPRHPADAAVLLRLLAASARWFVWCPTPQPYNSQSEFQVRTPDISSPGFSQLSAPQSLRSSASIFRIPVTGFFGWRHFPVHSHGFQ